MRSWRRAAHPSPTPLVGERRRQSRQSLSLVFRLPRRTPRTGLPGEAPVARTTTASNRRPQCECLSRDRRGKRPVTMCFFSLSRTFRRRRPLPIACFEQSRRWRPASAKPDLRRRSGRPLPVNAGAHWSSAQPPPLFSHPQGCRVLTNSTAGFRFSHEIGPQTGHEVGRVEVFFRHTRIVCRPTGERVCPAGMRREITGLQAYGLFLDAPF